MSEKEAKKFEVFEDSPAEKEHSSETKHDNVDLAKEKTNQAEKLLAARERATEESAEKDKLLEKLSANQETEEETASLPVSDDLKLATFQKEIRHIRRKLSKGDRLGSRVIHQPLIKNVSELSAKTITRPSGLLGGGITAFLGTSIYLYLTKHIGLKYNYAIFLLLLVAGFILGLAIEGVLRMTRGKRSI